MGASNANDDGEWRWTSTGELVDGLPGEPDVYTSWQSGQPSGDGQCVRMTAWGTWDAHPCDTAEAFACEIEDTSRASVRRKSEVISMDEGEARYVEVLHVHNASADDALLGLMLHVEPPTACVRHACGRRYSLSMNSSEMVRGADASPAACRRARRFRLGGASQAACANDGAHL